MTMTTSERTLFDLPTELPKVGTYVPVGQGAGKILRYSPDHKTVTVEQWIQGNKHEKTYSVDVLNPQTVDEAAPAPAPVMARQGFGVVVEADSPDEVTRVIQKLKSVLASEGISLEELPPPDTGMVAPGPAPKPPQWEIKILRQHIDVGDVDNHEAALADMLNDGWKIMFEKSCRVKGRFPAMWVVIYLKRRKPPAAEPTPDEPVDAVENVPSPMPATLPPADPAPEPLPEEPLPELDAQDDAPPVELHWMNRLGYQTIHEPERVVFLPDKPPSLSTFDDALAAHAAGQITMAEVLAIGDRQAMDAGRNTFVSAMMARQEQVSMLHLPVLPQPVDIPA